MAKSIKASLAGFTFHIKYLVQRCCAQLVMADVDVRETILLHLSHINHTWTACI